MTQKGFFPIKAHWTGIFYFFMQNLQVNSFPECGGVGFHHPYLYSYQTKLEARIRPRPRTFRRTGFYTMTPPEAQHRTHWFTTYPVIRHEIIDPAATARPFFAIQLHHVGRPLIRNEKRSRGLTWLWGSWSSCAAPQWNSPELNLVDWHTGLGTGNHTVAAAEEFSAHLSTRR